MKKKQVIVVKKIEKGSPKKEVYISRKVLNHDSIDNPNEWKESFVGNPAPQRPTRDAHENILTRSILGDPKVFESFVDMEDVPPSPVIAVKRNLKHSDTSASAGSNHVSNKKKSVFIQPPVKPDPSTHPSLYLESLKQLKMKASKLRDKEIEKETKLIQYLPVNERFDLNKEGKVLAMWQERQKKWNKIQKSLAKRVGGTTESLMMNTGDEFRARNEEYDVLQAAIPVHERFGAETWKMMLRDGTERSVTIGHVFSGLSCPVSIKTSIPAIIRKPRQGGPPRKNNTFIDPTPSLLRRQKQLQKTLQTLRPHSLGPLEVEGFVIASQNLFDWAIQSSEKYFREKQSLQQNKTPSSKVVKITTPADEKLSLENEVKSYSGPQITFLSSRNILFSGLQDETIHQTIFFKNTGPSAMSFTWKSIPEKELHEPSDVALIMSQRNNQPRAHILSKERSPFFCSHPSGQILPGETVETVFSFCSKGSGGNFLETWILDTLPRAVVYYPPTLSKPITNSSENLPSRTQQSSVPLPSTVYVKLKGHSYTLDECQHRRDHVTNLIHQGSRLGNMIDTTYFMIRRVREPLTIFELNQRKLNLFKDINERTLQSFSSLFSHKDQIKLTLSRFHDFLRFREEVVQYSLKLSEKFIETLELLQDSESSNISGLSQTNFQDISSFSLPDNTLQMSIRNSLFPEQTIEIFDEVTEEMISSDWNYDLQELIDFIQQLIQTAVQIQSFEELISKNQLLIEKARVSAERKAQDSDYEDDDEEEPEFEEGDEIQKPKSLLLQHVESFQFQLRQLIFILLIDPLPQYSHYFSTSLADSFDDIETFKANSLEVAGLKGDLIVSPIPSPFTTQEGEETWQAIFALRQPPIAGKKTSAPKPQKGYASDEQRKKYYLNFYELLSGALLQGILQGLCGIDIMMNQINEQRQQNATSFSNLTEISCFRREDFPSSPSPTIFLTFNGDAFGSLSGSAFDLQKSLRYESFSSLLPLVEYGAETIVLLFESNPSNFFGVSYPGIAEEITTTLLQLWNQKKVPKHHQKVNLSIQTKYIPTMAELNFFLENQNKITLSKSPRSNSLEGGSRSVTILLLENLLSSSLLPKTPEYVEEMSDDEDDSIPIGLHESKQAKFEAWKSLEPRNLSVSIEVMGRIQTVNCLTDGAAAINHLVSKYHGICIEGDIRSLFPCPNGVLKNWNFSNTLVSSQIREMMVWLGVLLHFPLVPFIRSETEKTAVELLTFGDYLSSLFPTATIPQPTLVITIGGQLTTEKFRFLEYAIDLSNTIILVGEFSLPFLLAVGVVFTRGELYSGFKTVCGNLIAKARLRGVELVLPADLTVGDELISPEQMAKSSTVIDRDARDEGGDYEGEGTVVTCDPKGLSIPGYPFDIGPLTCQNIRSIIPQHSLHLSWGTAGCCEISTFQAGQRALVESSIAKPNSTSLPPRNLVIGEANVEWWSRICDSEGEFDGNIVKKGDADFVCRSSSTFTSIISHLPSTHISNILRRSPNLDEWDYLTAVRKEDEEEEEDEDEEEEDD